MMKPVRLGPTIFSRMCNLRYLRWNEFPLKSLPLGFLPETLVELKLPGSQLEIFLEEDNKVLLLSVVLLAGNTSLVFCSQS